MKKPANLPVAGALALPCLLLLASRSMADNWPMIYESYDKNPLGDMIGQASGGYGVTGKYVVQGTESAAREAFRVVSGGLAFGSFNTVTPASRCVEVSAGDTACGVGIQVDGGKAVGDYEFFAYDKLYCSYLVNFSNFTSRADGRAEVRTSTAASGGSNFQVHTDTGGASMAQPGLAYSGTNYDRAPSPTTNTLALNTTYLMIGKFTSAGNQLSFTPTATWTVGLNTITVSSNANLQIGQLATGTGLADNSIVTSISGTTVTLSQPTVSGGGTATTVHFREIASKKTPAVVSYNHTSNARLLNFVSTTISASDISVGMAVTPATIGIPVGAKVASFTQSGGYVTSVTIDQDLTATPTTTPPTRGVVFRNPTVLSANWTSGQSVITVSSNPGIAKDQAVLGAGIQPNTYVTDVTGNQITLSAPTTAPGTSTTVHFLLRTGLSSLYALTLPQFENFIASGATDETRQTYLNTTPIGTAANQISVRISGTIAATGSIEFGHGRYVHLVAWGTNASRQAYKMDELRYGLNLRSVTQPNTFATVPASDPAAFDGFTGVPDLSFYYHDTGYGWKSGWYEIEETATTQGAYGLPRNLTGLELLSGNGPYLSVLTRSDVSSDQGLRRRPDPAVVDMTKPYTVTFDYRCTTSLTNFNQFTDRIQFGADVGVAAGSPLNLIQSSNLGPNPTRPGLTSSPITAGTAINWMVGVIGGTEGSRNVFPRRWYFYDFKNATLPGSDPPNYFVGGNMVLASDDNGTESAPDTDAIPQFNNDNSVYSFKIEANPLTFTYRGTIYYRVNDTSPISATYSRGGLQFRDNVPADALFWSIFKRSGTDRAFAMDNIRVSPGVDFFPDWVASYASITDPALKTRSADADNDGRKNFLEYALDGNPASGASSGKVQQSVTTISSSQYHTLTVPVRTEMTFGASSVAGEEGDLISTFTNNEGIKYRIEGSYDLVNWNAQVVQLPSSLATTPVLSTNPGYAYRTFRLAQPISATHPKGFLRVMVETTK